MTSLCLCMIVKDEAAVIERCLRSVRGAIDTWVICDTGSTDGTQNLVRRALEGVPGELFERPWRNFGANRTELARLAEGRADYLLMLDADDTVRIDPSGVGTLGADQYLIRHEDNPEYWLPRLVRSDRRWRYVGTTHEHLEGDGLCTSARLDAIVIKHHADGGSRGQKFERDLVLLQEQLKSSPDDPRTMLYLGLTHYGLGNHEEAISWYDRRTRLGGWEEEIFYARYQIGAIRADLGDWAAAVPELLAAWNYRPARLEPLYRLANGYRVREAYETAHLFAARALDRPQPPDDILFVEPLVYRWGVLFEYSITAYYVGDPGGALRACDRLLEMEDLPADYAEQVRRNREFCLQRARRTEPVSSTLGNARVVISTPAERR